MSSEARVWKAKGLWYGDHDGVCPLAPEPHSSEHLQETLKAVQDCYGHPLYWEVHTIDTGETWLRAYVWPRE